MNLLLILLIITLGAFFVIISNYLFEKENLMYTYIIYNIISFILSFKIIEIFKINISASIITSSLFSVLTYKIIEKVNTKEYKNIVIKIFTINLIVSTLLFICSLFVGSVRDIHSIELKNMILGNYKILISYPFITLFIQLISMVIYKNIHNEIENNKYKIIITILNSYIIEATLFVIFSYIFKMNYKNMFELIINNYLIKLLISIIYIPFINYLFKKKKAIL